jgi:hypothetical protein
MIQTALMNVNWTYLNDMETNIAYDDFNAQLNSIIETYAPEQTVLIQPKYIIREEWMTKGLMKSSRTCTKLYRKSLGKPKMNIQYTQYITYRNCFNKIKQTAKKNYYAQLFKDFKNDTKKTWNLVRSMIGKSNDKSFTPTIFQHNNEKVSNPQKIANHFCKFFTNVGPNYANAIPKPNIEFPHYLANKTHTNSSSMFMQPTEPNEVLKVIKSLHPKNSFGHDNISSRFF